MSFPTDQRPWHQDPASGAQLASEIAPLTVDEVPPRAFPMLPVVLFLLTCITTYMVEGLAYAIPVMGILLCHEFGHYIQARRYHVPASLPYFIPMPFGPLGTMGAVIGMGGTMGNRRALFDIGITGPLAGLVPAIVCSYVGLRLSTIVDIARLKDTSEHVLGAPPLFHWLATWAIGPPAMNHMIDLHPLAVAGWVGIFITALNLIPIGQLDGGHVLYALLRTKAHLVATLLLILALLGVTLTGNYGWTLMLVLLVMMGPNHPPTANDEMPLGTGRTILGWVTLLFVFVGFTPTPFLR